MDWPALTQCVLVFLAAVTAASSQGKRDHVFVCLIDFFEGEGGVVGGGGGGVTATHMYAPQDSYTHLSVRMSVCLSVNPFIHPHTYTYTMQLTPPFLPLAPPPPPPPLQSIRKPLGKRTKVITRVVIKFTCQPVHLCQSVSQLVIRLTKINRLAD